MSSSAQSYSKTGFVYNSETKEPLQYANIVQKKSNNGVESNQDGYFAFTSKKDTVEVIISYIGYNSIDTTFYLKDRTNIIIFLKPVIALNTIDVVEKKKKTNLEALENRIDISSSVIKSTPVLFGEADVLKTLQLFPGVQSSGEGQNGLNIRGGSPDQNLILLDGVPIYNASHVLGIFSVFNPDAIQDVSLIKGGFPARFGGRLSSIIEIKTKEGDFNAIHGEGSIGLISSKLTVGGPIKKKKLSFLLSGRRTYADLLLGNIIDRSYSSEVDIDSNVYFYDFIGKISYRPNKKHNINFSFYSEADNAAIKFEETGDSFSGITNWQNIIGNVNWNYLINDRTSLNSKIYYNNFDISATTKQVLVDNGIEQAYSAKYLSNIEDFGGDYNLKFIPSPDYRFQIGSKFIYQKYTPGALAINSTLEENAIDTSLVSNNQSSLKFEFYSDNEMKFNKLKMNIGLHYSLYLIDKQTFSSLEPRISFNYLLNSQLAIKGSFSRMRQYINLLTSEAFSIPLDLWVPSTEKVIPQDAYQIDGEIVYENGAQEISLGGYFKKMENLISFKEGASFLFGIENDWQEKITQGLGRLYQPLKYPDKIPD